jgi:hypothetical protein
MDFEARSANRIPSENLLAFRLLDENGAVINEGMVISMDISRNGIALLSKIPMPAGLKIELSIGMGDEVVIAGGRIQNQKKIGEDNYQIGVEFNFLNDEDLNKIAMHYPSILR